MTPTGWRIFLTNCAIVGCTTAVAILTKSVELVTACGVVFIAISGGAILNKKIQGEQALKSKVGQP